jgi:hypothetical protein
MTVGDDQLWAVSVIKSLSAGSSRLLFEIVIRSRAVTIWRLMVKLSTSFSVSEVAVLREEHQPVAEFLPRRCGCRQVKAQACPEQSVGPIFTYQKRRLRNRGRCNHERQFSLEASGKLCGLWTFRTRLYRVRIAENGSPKRAWIPDELQSQTVREWLASATSGKRTLQGPRS